MAKEKTYVKVDSHESDNGEVYGKDEHGKIIKIEQKWNPQKRWNKFRLFADDETRAALLEDGTVVEFFIERSDSQRLVGNIYKGKVENVLPGMQLAMSNILRGCRRLRITVTHS